MSEQGSDRKRSGFKRRTRVDDARSALRDRVDPIDRTERIGPADADGRVLAETVTADRDVPHYRRAAMDGYAVRAADTFGASDRSPAVLRVVDDEPPAPGEAPASLSPDGAVRVHTGSALPETADAVAMIEDVERVGDDLEILDAVADGENVAPVGEDVEAGQTLFAPGHRLRPSDLGLVRSAGVDDLTVRPRPSVGIVPTGEEVVASDPGPGEVVGTNGLTVSRLVERWNGRPQEYGIVPDEGERLREAIGEAAEAHDVVVTTGGSSVGERDLVPEAVGALGEVVVHGVALKPGHPVALGVVEGTPVLCLPGYPVACIVNAVQFLRPVLSWLQGTTPDPVPTVRARLARKVPSEPGVRTFARVTLSTDDDQESVSNSPTNEGGETSVSRTASNDEESVGRTATPTRASGSGVLSSVALADGWVVVPEAAEGLAANETVAVEYWEGWP